MNVCCLTYMRSVRLGASMLGMFRLCFETVLLWVGIVVFPIYNVALCASPIFLNYFAGLAIDLSVFFVDRRLSV